MLFNKLHFKWEKSLNTGEFKLDQHLSADEIVRKLERDEDSFKVKSNPNIRLKLDHQNRIKFMLFTKGTSIGGIEISWRHIRTVIEELEDELEECDEHYTGDKLILHFGDAFLGVASLVRGTDQGYEAMDR